MHSIAHVLLAALALLALSGQVDTAQAHSWYPSECCHDRDCAEVIALTRLADGRVRIETAIGFATVPAGFATRPSPDGRPHACLRDA